MMNKYRHRKVIFMGVGLHHNAACSLGQTDTLVTKEFHPLASPNIVREASFNGDF